MVGLVLKLAPRERVLINGVLIKNGNCRTRIVIHTRTNILCLKDIILPDDVNKSPLHQAIFYLQTILSCEGRQNRQRFAVMLAEVKRFLSLDPEITREWSRRFAQEEYYQIFKEM